MDISLKLSEDDFELFYGFLYGLSRRAKTVDPGVKSVIDKLFEQMEPAARKHLGFEYEKHMRSVDDAISDLRHKAEDGLSTVMSN